MQFKQLRTNSRPRRPHSRAEYVKAETDMKLAEIERKRIELRLARSQILSPADGKVRAAEGNLSDLVGTRVIRGDLLLSRPVFRLCVTGRHEAVSVAGGTDLYRPLRGQMCLVSGRRPGTEVAGGIATGSSGLYIPKAESLHWGLALCRRADTRPSGVRPLFFSRWPRTTRPGLATTVIPTTS